MSQMSQHSCQMFTWCSSTKHAMSLVLLVGCSKYCSVSGSFCGASHMFFSHGKKMRAVNTRYILKHVRRNFASAETTPANRSKWSNFQPFSEMLAERKAEANKSILIEVRNYDSCAKLTDYCSSISGIKNAFFYSALKKNFMLIEFHDEEGKESIIARAEHASYMKVVPVTSVYLWYRETSHQKLRESSEPIPVKEDTVYSEEQAIKKLSEEKGLSKQMQILYDSMKMSDMDYRLRFLTCAQLERALSGVFPEANAVPFGSSVSGVGRRDGDLDIFLKLDRKFDPHKSPQHNGSKLIFHSKTCGDDRTLQLRFLANMISVILPGCHEVRSIMSARVPIVKYKQVMTGVECDVQNSSGSGVDMSHLLWVMVGWDQRLAPLIFTLRQWAKMNGLTSSERPTPSLTNFTLTILAIFFLQNEGILPSLKYMNKIASEKSSLQYGDNGKVKFLQDLRSLTQYSWPKKESTLGTLLLKFFRFYQDYDFLHNAISIIDGTEIRKPDPRPMYIVNPLEPDLNITANVALDELLRFQKTLKTSVEVLEGTDLLGILPIMNRNEEKQSNRKRIKKRVETEVQARYMNEIGGNKKKR